MSSRVTSRQIPARSWATRTTAREESTKAVRVAPLFECLIADKGQPLTVPVELHAIVEGDPEFEFRGDRFGGFAELGHASWRSELAVPISIGHGRVVHPGTTMWSNPSA